MIRNVVKYGMMLNHHWRPKKNGDLELTRKRNGDKTSNEDAPTWMAYIHVI